MAEKITLARPYATAVFRQAREESDLDGWGELLHFLRAVVEEPTLAALVSDPRVEGKQLTELLLGICEGRLSKTRENLIKVLVQSRRLELVPEIAELFDREREEHERRSRVEVTSAFELEEDNRRVIANAMAERLGREVELSVTVDRSLIGGVVVRAGDLVIDASLRGRLRQLSTRLG